MAPEVVAAAAARGGGGDRGEDNGFDSKRKLIIKLLMIFAVVRFMRFWKDRAGAGKGGSASAGGGGGEQRMRNLYGSLEECDLWVHFSLNRSGPPIRAVLDETVGAADGFRLLWHERVRYEEKPTPTSRNVSLGTLPEEVLHGAAAPFVHATLLRTALLERPEDIPDYQVIQQSLALVEKLRELRADDQAVNLLTADGEPTGRPTNLSATRLPYFKTKIEVRPVFDQTVYTRASLKSGPTKRFQAFPKLGVYQPYLYLSDFWLLEKDYLLLDSTLKGTAFNLTLTYSAASMLAYASQTQMTEQWAVKSEWGLTDTQRDSFMVKRLIIETNPYFLAFSACFILLHIVFQTLAFKSDIQFWRKNESMEGLSARTEIVSFVCRLVMTLYLLDSKEASRLVIFPVILDLVLGVWRLRKAVKLELKLSFPFISFGNQPGYENSGTSKYDDEATYYMLAMMAPAFLGYVVRSAIHGRHRSWYSFLVGSAAGGVYTFGFIMMTPQLYINYRLKSVERLPWRAMTYKAMNTFVDDISAFLIDMPMMHRVSCFRDDVIFFIYLYQRWTYRVDKTRPSQWVREEEPAADAVAPLGVDPPAAPRAPDQDPGGPSASSGPPAVPAAAPAAAQARERSGAVPGAACG